MPFPAKRVPPYALWIGSEADSRDVASASRHGVALVVNCTRDLPFRVPGVRAHRVPVHDSPDEGGTMLAHLPVAVALIDAALASGRGVLVHCFAGVSRSASVVAAFLMYKEGLTPRQAIARIRRVKPETFGEPPTFLRALEAFHATLRRLRG